MFATEQNGMRARRTILATYCIHAAADAQWQRITNRKNSLKTDPIAKLRVPAKRAETLTMVLGQSEQVTELVKESVKDLSSVNTVIKQELEISAQVPEVASALRKNIAVENKVRDASEKLMAVNQALGGEVRERDLVDHQLAAATQSEAAARYAALHDVLTGLPNRALFEDHLALGLAQAKRNGRTLAVMFIDLDGFKNVNDTYGHDAGDAVLRITAQRLLDNTRSGDTLSRFGGDEFLCLLMDIKEEADIAMIAGKIIKAIQAPFNIVLRNPENQPTVGASIGISIFPEHGTAADALVKSADKAMYRAKRDASGYAFACSEPQ